MLKLEHIHDPDKNYRVRVSMPVSMATIVVPGSIVSQCDECGTDVWIDPNMPMKVPPGVTIHGDVTLCLPCTSAHAAYANAIGKGVVVTHIQPPPQLD